ncbi:zeta toxin family protein [Neisseria montereyensis]|uniref:Zeta toxin family protein n=1 Tax=Neisseria montereyensis TaxID=2973938 RepID=A0ABT2FEX5_9NEIS|nr:zeta toxin family protein [Neisseria montereyensis]MCS4534685.1 zeta toxin family protein [Neisseria montereyensis]
MTSQPQYKPLSDNQSKTIVERFYQHRIDKASQHNKPIAILVSGQPGAGKTQIAVQIKKELRKSGGYIHVDADRMREKLPKGKNKFPSEVTQADAGKLVALLRNQVIANHYNFVEEGTFRNPDQVGAFVDKLKAKGYQVEMMIVAVHFEQSILGIYQRYELQVNAHAHSPRLVPDDYHRLAFNGFTETVKNQAKQFDRIRVVTRAGQILFDSLSPEEKRTPYEALIQGREMDEQAILELKNGWENILNSAQNRNADKDYLAKIMKNLDRVKQLLNH